MMIEIAIAGVVGSVAGYWIGSVLYAHYQRRMTAKRRTEDKILRERLVIASQNAREFRKLGLGKFINPCQRQCKFAEESGLLAFNCKALCKYTLRPPGDVPVLTDDVRKEVE